MAYAYLSSTSLHHPRLCDGRAFAHPLLNCKTCKARSAQRSLVFETRASSGNEQPDLIERVFGRIFGNKALEERSPGGMRRMSEEAMLEQYPATLTEFAAPVDSDDKTMAKIRPLLAQTRLQKVPLRCAKQCCLSGGCRRARSSLVCSLNAEPLIHAVYCKVGIFSCTTWLEQLSISSASQYVWRHNHFSTNSWRCFMWGLQPSRLDR